VPTGVFGFVVIVKVVVPEPVTEVGTNEELARAGNPLRRKLTGAANGPNAATDTVNVVVQYLPTVWLLGEAEIEKSATCRETFAVWLRLPLVAVIVSG
jgi:hypothetical protein